MRPQTYRVTLDEETTARLLLLVRQGSAPARVIRRANTLLLASEGKPDPVISQALHEHVATVARTRKRFCDAGLEAALYDQPRPGAAPKLDAAGEAHLIALACSAPPEGRAVWSMQLLADRLVELQVVDAISDEAVRRTLGKKPAQAVAEGALVHVGGGRRLRQPHGRRAGPLRRGGGRTA
jgi:transposase